MTRILITGVSGFVGHHLARELKQQGHTVIGTGTRASLDPALTEYIDEYYGECDLTQELAVAALPLEAIDAVINLAGLAQVGASFDQPDKYMNVNVAVHTTIIKRLAKVGKKTVRVVAISTGAVYDSNQPMPIAEDGKLVSQGSPYALSKIAMEKALRTYQDNGMDIIIARPFNHIGPGQEPGFLVPDLAQQLSEITPGNTMKIGNLATKRDYTDVRDVARAYQMLATADTLTHSIYNVCSGKSVAGTKILAELQAAMGLAEVTTEVDESRFRPTDAQDIIGDASSLGKDTGWKPNFQLEQTIKDFVAAR